MVTDMLWDAIVNLSSSLLSWLNAPELLEKNLITQFPSLIPLAAIFAIPIVSLLFGKRKKLMLLSAGFAVFLLMGSIYAAIFLTAVQVLMMFLLWFIFKREKGFKEPKMEEPSFEEPKAEEPSFQEPQFETPKEPETPPPPPDQPVETEYTCQTCGSKLVYVPQYQKYYCNGCQSYL